MESGCPTYPVGELGVAHRLAQPVQVAGSLGAGHVAEQASVADGAAQPDLEPLADVHEALAGPELEVGRLTEEGGLRGHSPEALHRVLAPIPRGSQLTTSNRSPSASETKLIQSSGIWAPAPRQPGLINNVPNRDPGPSPHASPQPAFICRPAVSSP
jgi:hypothetical protein